MLPPLLVATADVLTQVTTYGGPRDPFVKVVDRYTKDADGNTQIERQVLARGYLKNVQCEVKFV